MKAPAFKTEEKQVKKPILIVDKVGVIGKSLSEELSKDYLVFFASKKNYTSNTENIIYIPFSKKIPRVPDNRYAKIFIIDDGEVVTRESLSSFLKKAKQIDSPIYFLGSIRNIYLEHSDEIIRSYPKAKVLIFGDLFDNDILFDKRSSVTKFIIEARKNKQIKVPGDGLSLNYPISFKDSIKLIIKASYIDMPERAVLLFARHPITDISLANTFQKIDPEIDVDFENEEKEKVFYFPKNSQYALAKYDLKKKLSEVDLESGEQEVLGTAKNFEFKYIKPILFFILACIFLLFLPFLTTYTYLFLGKHQLSNAKNLAEKGKFEDALKKSVNAEKFYSFALQTAGPLEYQAKLIKREEISDSLVNKIGTGSDLSKSSSSLLEGAISLEKLMSGDTANSKNEIENAVESFKKANVILQDLNVSGQIPEEFRNNLKNILPLLSIISDSSDILPEVLGFDNEKTYLVLFNDNTELRPSGGVTGSIGILKIKNGRVTNFETTNTNTLDQRLNNFVEPPYFLRRHLPAEKMLLRDSGTSPDFVTNAINSSSIYKLESGVDVDGVIGLNLDFAKSLLSVTDQVELKEENSVVTAENIYEKASKFNNNKQDFYQELIDSIRSKDKKPQYFSLMEKIGKGIGEKEIIFALKESGSQSILTANNLSGSLIDQRDNSQSINDYFGISESNLGKNNISRKISRSVIRKLMIDGNRQLISEVKISFKNDGEGNDSTYKNYLQLILPAGSSIQEVSVGGKRVEMTPAITNPGVYERDGFVSPEDLEVEQREEQGKSIFGFLVVIPPQSVKVITITYMLPLQLSNSEKNYKYSLIVYKQPGVESYPFSQSFNFPPNFLVIPSGVISEEIRNDRKFNFLISEK